MNKEIFLYINSFAGNGIGDMAGILVAEYMPFVFIAVEVYLYFIKKAKDEAIFAFDSMLVGLVVNWAITLFYFHNRPFMDHLGRSLIKHANDSSFPSDHTTFMISIAVSLFLCKDTRNWGVFLILLSLVGGVGRVFVGVHYPFDIIGSIFTGSFGALAVFWQKDRIKKINAIVYKIEKAIGLDKI